MMMAEQMPYIVSSVGVLVLALADRFILRRGAVKLIKAERSTGIKGYRRFALSFQKTKRTCLSEMNYVLRDKQDPSTVIAGKPRSLESAETGIVVREYLLFSDKLPMAKGPWVLDVRVETTGSRINPFYKIFPLISVIREDIQID
ncbi:hypothetical protein [Thaumasiovibrio sp. DFM-14]|uniref:hypothetical protein n=1 Tax=Thaumasiovibrio sp. DFM-14 TaxID=3384792 RepID=UPI0039A2B616